MHVYFICISLICLYIGNVFIRGLLFLDRYVHYPIVKLTKYELPDDKIGIMLENTAWTGVQIKRIIWVENPTYKFAIRYIDCCPYELLCVKRPSSPNHLRVETQYKEINVLTEITF